MDNNKTANNSYVSDGVVLENERSGHVEKLVNELSTYKFYKYINSRDMFKIIGLNLLMCIFLIPLVVLYYNYYTEVLAFNSSVPLEGSLGMGFSFWSGLEAYSTVNLNSFVSKFWLLAIPAFVVIAFGLAGGTCVMRDAYWTGRLKVLKTFFVGIYQCGLVAIICFALLGTGVFGLIKMNMALVSLAKVWQVVINILAWAAFVFVALYMFVLVSVTATYKQNFFVNLKTSMAIYKKYFVSTLLNFLIAFVPLYLLLLLAKGAFGVLVICLVAMIGMFFVALVWQCHMMRVFSIYHPVERKIVKRKKVVEETVIPKK